MPASLVAFYQLLGRRDDLTSNQDDLVPLSSLAVEDRVWVHRFENQGCASWGVRVCDLGLANPPVVMCRDDSPWHRFLGSFSLAAVEIVLYEALFAAAEGCHDARRLGGADVVRLEELYERLPFPDSPA